jgi:hypothetical protein
MRLKTKDRYVHGERGGVQNQSIAVIELFTRRRLCDVDYYYYYYYYYYYLYLSGIHGSQQPAAESTVLTNQTMFSFDRNYYYLAAV